MTIPQGRNIAGDLYKDSKMRRDKKKLLLAFVLAAGLCLPELFVAQSQRPAGPPTLQPPRPRPTGKLTLQQTVQYAVENYPAIRASLAQVAAQAAGIGLARTSYLPRMDSMITANLGSRNNVPGLLFPGSLVPPISGPASDTISGGSVWGSATAMLFTWEPIDFGYRQATVAAAESQVGRAGAAAAMTKLDVAVKAGDAFLRLAAAEETVRAARANVERNEVLANTVSVLVRNELRPGADESRARAELAAARIQLIQAEQNEQISRANLAQWLGISAKDVQIAAEPQLQESPTGLDAPLNLAVHPQALGQMSIVDSVRAREKILAESYYPRVYLQSAFSLRGTGARVNGVNLGGLNGLAPTTPNWAVGFTVTFPVFDFASLRERKRTEEQNESAELALYDKVMQELNSQVEQAQAQSDGAERIAENTPIQLEAARVSEQQARARYQAGLATIIEVADAQRLLLQSEIGDAVARLGVWRARLAEAAARGDISEFLK
jgi:outer membrane protein TolC